MRHIVPISGKDSLAAALVLREEGVVTDAEYVWHDTGWELREVHEWIRSVESVIGPIHRCGDNLDDIVAEQGLLPSPMKRFCTKYAKIKPMRDWLGKSPRFLYLGLRADEPSRINGLTPSKGETLRFPLQERGLALADVWELVSRYQLLPPQFIWPWMVNRVAELGGTRPVDMPDWEWNQLFAGRSRPNCDRCFFQRQYEWIWLHETHPDLFMAAVETERSTQAKSDFKLIGKDKPLESLLDRAGQIKEARARQILRILGDRGQRTLFDTDDDLLATVSCGLYCGK